MSTAPVLPQYPRLIVHSSRARSWRQNVGPAAVFYQSVDDRFVAAAEAGPVVTAEGPGEPGTAAVNDSDRGGRLAQPRPSAEEPAADGSHRGAECDRRVDVGQSGQTPSARTLVGPLGCRMVATLHGQVRGRPRLRRTGFCCVGRDTAVEWSALDNYEADGQRVGVGNLHNPPRRRLAGRRPAAAVARDPGRWHRSAQPAGGVDLNGSLCEPVRMFVPPVTRPSAPTAGYVRLQQTPYRAHDLTRRAVLRSIRPGGRIFEGGVSSGYFAQLLVEAGYHVDGADLDSQTIKEAAAFCDVILVGDLATIDLSGLRPPYDGFVFGDTLEHLPDPAAVLRRLRPLLRDEGAVVISIPNIANWAVRLGLLFGRFRYTERGILDRTHLRFYTRKTLIGMLEDAGLRVDELVASVPVPLLTWRPLCWLAYRIGNLRPSLFGYGFVLVARPTHDSAASHG